MIKWWWHIAVNEKLFGSLSEQYFGQIAKTSAAGARTLILPQPNPLFLYSYYLDMIVLTYELYAKKTNVTISVCVTINYFEKVM